MQVMENICPTHELDPFELVGAKQGAKHLHLHFLLQSNYNVHNELLLLRSETTSETTHIQYAK